MSEVVERDLTPDEQIELQEKIIHGRASEEQLELFGKYMDKRLEKIIRESSNLVYQPNVPDSYFRAAVAGMREIRIWKQSLLIKKEQGSRMSRMLDVLLRRRKREVIDR